MGRDTDQKRAEQIRKEMIERDQKRYRTLHRDHRSPVSRRDFLARSAYGIAGSILMPSAFNLLSSRVSAQSLECNFGNALESSMAPIMVLDFAGGACFSAQDFQVGGAGGQLDYLSSNQNFGIPDEKRVGPGGAFANADTEYGIAFHPESPFLAGLNSRLSAGIRQQVDGFIMASKSGDDTNNNEMGCQFMPSVLGRTGTIANAVSSRTGPTPTGGRHRPAQGSYRAEAAPVPVGSSSAAQKIGGQGKLYSLLSTSKAERILSAINQMSPSRVQTFQNLSLPEQTRILVDCGYLRSVELPSLYAPNTIFPLDQNGNPTEANINTAFNSETFNNRNDGVSPTGALAAISRLILHGYSGVGTVEFGGYDDHDGTAVSMRNRAWDAGRFVARVVQYFALENKPIVIMVTTDGAMGNNGTPDNNVDVTGTSGYFGRPGDGGQFSVYAVFAFIPGSSRGSLIANPGRQIGHYSTNGVVNTSSIAADNPTRVAQLAIFNYLALHGRENEMVNVTGGSDLLSSVNADLSKYLIFKKSIG